MAEQDEQVLMTEMERNSTGVSTQSMDQSDSGGANNPDKSQAVKTDDSNPQANGIGGDNEQGEAGPSNDSQVVLETETGLDKVESIDQFEYIEPVPDPYNKAIKYLEQHSILQLFQVCIFKETFFGLKIYNNFADTK